MTNFEMFYTNLINEVDQNKVNEIKESMKKNGYVGTPIFYTEYILLTGSHRYEALKQLADEEIEIEFNPIDLTNLVEEYLAENDETHMDIEFDEINDMNEEEIINYFTIMD